jgi:hypothetical protein
MYIEIVRVKFTGPEYIKAHLRYYSKSSNTLLAEERNVKLMKKGMKHWERWNG